MESGENQNQDEPAAEQAETQARSESAAEDTTPEDAASAGTTAEATGADTAATGPQVSLLPAPSGEERTWAVLAHLLAIGGFMTGFGWLGWVGPLVVWVKRRQLGPFVAFHALQALFFQLIWVGVLFVGIRVAVVIPEFIYPWFFAGAVPVLWSIVGAIKAGNGEWYQYPCVGQWALELTDQSE
jgi:uncharacterized Tic20 family protein